MFLEGASTDPQYFASWVGFAIFSICVHESAHARMAVHFGDETLREYIPLNPAKQTGWFSIRTLFRSDGSWRMFFWPCGWHRSVALPEPHAGVIFDLSERAGKLVFRLST